MSRFVLRLASLLLLSSLQACGSSGDSGDTDQGVAAVDAGSADAAEVPEYAGSACYPLSMTPPTGPGVKVGEPCTFDSCMIDSGSESETCAENLFCFRGECAMKCAVDSDCDFMAEAAAIDTCADPAVECLSYEDFGSLTVCAKLGVRSYKRFSVQCIPAMLEGREEIAAYEPGSFPAKARSSSGYYYAAKRCKLEIYDDAILASTCEQAFKTPAEDCGAYDPCCQTCDSGCDSCGNDMGCFTDCYGQCMRCCHRCG